MHYKLKSVALAVKFAMTLYRLKKSSRPTVKIFYATETGTAKKFAKRLEANFSSLFNIKIIEMNKFEKSKGKISLQGTPYLFARYKIAIFSICTDNFQNIFFTKQGSRDIECLYLMVF